MDSFPLVPPDFQDYVLFKNTLVYEYKKLQGWVVFGRDITMEDTAHFLTAYTDSDSQ